MSHVIETLEVAVTNLLKGLIATTGLVMVISLLIGVFYRYVLHNALAWTYELAMLTFTWNVFLAAALLVRRDEHVRVTMLVDMLPMRVQWVVDQVTWIILCITSVVTAWLAWEYTLFNLDETSPAIGYPIWSRNAALVAGGLLMLLYSVRHIASYSRFINNKKQPESK